MPANSQLFMSAIFGFVTYDLYDTSALTASFYSPEDVEVNEKHVQLGYKSAFCLINLGSCLYLVIGQAIVAIL